MLLLASIKYGKAMRRGSAGELCVSIEKKNGSIALEETPR